MKQFFSYVVVIGLLGCHVSQARQEKPTTINTHREMVIDQKSTSAMWPVMPDTLKDVVNRWVEDNKDVLYVLIPETDNVPLTHSAVGKAIARNNQMLESKGFKNLSNNNYIVELPNVEGKRYFMQMSGPVNIAINILHGNGYNNDDIEDKFTDNSLKTMNTFQTVSRFSGYLGAQEIIDQEKITTFKVPATYLVQIPGRNNNAERCACDENSIVVQEDIGDNYVQIRSNLSLLPNVSGQTLRDVFTLIKYGLLWDINHSGLISKDTYMFGQTDLEQPNNENPQNFFNKNATKSQWNVACGIEGIVKLYQEASESCDVTEGCILLKELIEQDQDLRQSPHWSYIENQVAILDNLIKQYIESNSFL